MAHHQCQSKKVRLYVERGRERSLYCSTLKCVHIDQPHSVPGRSMQRKCWCFQLRLLINALFNNNKKSKISRQSYFTPFISYTAACHQAASVHTSSHLLSLMSLYFQSYLLYGAQNNGTCQIIYLFRSP